MSAVRGLTSKAEPCEVGLGLFSLQAGGQAVGEAGRRCGWGIARGCVDHSEHFSLTIRPRGFPDGTGMIRFVFCKGDVAPGWRRDGSAEVDVVVSCSKMTAATQNGLFMKLPPWAGRYPWYSNPPNLCNSSA